METTGRATDALGSEVQRTSKLHQFARFGTFARLSARLWHPCQTASYLAAPLLWLGDRKQQNTTLGQKQKGCLTGNKVPSPSSHLSPCRPPRFSTQTSSGR